MMQMVFNSDNSDKIKGMGKVENNASNGDKIKVVCCTKRSRARISGASTFDLGLVASKCV